jgi:hypothetical protein
MNKNDIIINLVVYGFSFTFEGDNENNRYIIFTKKNFNSFPILMKELSELHIEQVCNEFKNK